jgi:hypothetical protein
LIAWILFIIASWLLADFIAGVFHWWEDTYLTQSDSFLGRLIGGPNQLHHANQYAFLQGSYWHRNYTTIIPSMIALVLCLRFEPIRSGWLAMLFVSQANQIHAWAHSKGRNFWLIDELQWIGLLQSCKHHSEHHRSPYHVRYCVMSPVLNPLLDGIGFWRGLEYIGFIVTGIRPRDNHASTN